MVLRRDRPPAGARAPAGGVQIGSIGSGDLAGRDAPRCATRCSGPLLGCCCCSSVCMPAAERRSSPRLFPGSTGRSTSRTASPRCSWRISQIVALLEPRRRRARRRRGDLRDAALRGGVPRARRDVAAIGQTFPPVAVLALAVPAHRFRRGAGLIALTLYGLLPVLENTIAGLGARASAGAAKRRAAIGLSAGRDPAPRRACRWRRPSSSPACASRSSSISALRRSPRPSARRRSGHPIIVGLVNGKVAYVIQGALVVGVFAIVTDLLFGATRPALAPLHLTRLEMMHTEAA